MRTTSSQPYLCSQESRPIAEAFTKFWAVGAESFLLNLDAPPVQAVRLVGLSL